MKQPVAQEITEILTMPAGSRLIYHVGLLANDRGPDRDSERTEAQRAVNESANIAWKLYERGVVALTQRRVAPFVFEYFATRLGAAVRTPAAIKIAA